MNNIYIEYDDNYEMMMIRVGDTKIFYGNYCDFDRDPKTLYEFLKLVGVESYLIERKCDDNGVFIDE